MTIWICSTISLLIGFFLGYHRGMVSGQPATKTYLSGLQKQLNLKKSNVGVVLPMSQEQVELRKDPKKFQEDKDGEEIFDQVLGEK